MRLAAQLTGWKLDINSESRVKEMREFADRSLGSLPGVNEMLVETLYAHGFRMAKDIAEANPEVLSQIPGLDAAKVAPMQETAQQADGQRRHRAREDAEGPRAAPPGRGASSPRRALQEERLARVRGIGTDQRWTAQAGRLRHRGRDREGDRPHPLGNVAGIGIKKARRDQGCCRALHERRDKRRAELDALKKAQAPSAPGSSTGASA